MPDTPLLREATERALTVKLPELPKAAIYPPPERWPHKDHWTAEQMREYATAAILADRKERDRDAERYRWLRGKTAERHDDFYADVDRWSVSKERGGMGQCFSGDRLDASIDRAMGDGNG